MSATRRSFTPEYKREAVRLADDLGNASKAARDLGITAGLIHRWRQQLRDDDALAAETFRRWRRDLGALSEEGPATLTPAGPSHPAWDEERRYDPDAAVGWVGGE